MHEIIKCSCGEVIAQCRCISCDKKVTIISRGCEKCRNSIKITTKSNPSESICDTCTEICKATSPRKECALYKSRARRDEMVKKFMVEFNKDHNYDDAIPDDMKNFLCHLISNKDWDGLTNFMRIGVDITRHECAGRSADFILEHSHEIWDFENKHGNTICNDRLVLKPAFANFMRGEK